MSCMQKLVPEYVQLLCDDALVLAVGVQDCIKHVPQQFLTKWNSDLWGISLCAIT